MLGENKTDLLDTLYAGFAGTVHHPDTLPDFSLITEETKQSHPEQISKIKSEYVPAAEVFVQSMNPQVDIRPRFQDDVTKDFILLDSGSQISACAPDPGDVLDPSIRLEAVDGSLLPCYGKKIMSIRIGRKMYHQEVIKTSKT